MNKLYWAKVKSDAKVPQNVMKMQGMIYTHVLKRITW